MVSITLSRGSTTVEIPLLSDGGGTPLCSVDLGKPNASVWDQTGSLDPRAHDFRSGQVTYSAVGRFIEDTAYSDAIALAELIKTQRAGEPITMNVGLDEFESDISVVPAAEQEQAVAINYPPGGRDDVQVDLGLTRVDRSQGGIGRDANIPTASGTGPITLSNGSDSVELVDDVDVEWSLGQPNDVVRADTNQYPYHISKGKAAYEAFELSFEFTSDAVANVTTIVDDIFTPRLERSGLTLDFNGLYGLGVFDVMPLGSAPLRTQRVAAEAGTTLVPQLSLRRIRTD